MKTDRQYESRGIDGLRTFGCIAIVFWHVYANGNYRFQGYFAKEILPSWDYLVYLFMMISGYGICNGYYLQFKNKNINLEYFYLRRYLKILPFFSLLILVDVLVEHSFSSIAEGIMELTLVFGFLPNNSLSVIGVGWTLGVIFAFYITFPFFVFLLSNKCRGVISCLISVLLQSLCSLYFMKDKFVVDGFVKRHNFLFCVPFFLVGGLIFLYKKEYINWMNKHIKSAIAIVVLITVAFYLLPKDVGEFSLVDIKCLFMYAAWLLIAIGIETQILNNKLTRYISKISMEIYLCHMLVFRILEKIGLLQMLGDNWISYVSISFLVVLCLVIIIPPIQLGLKFLVNQYKLLCVRE